MARHVPCPLDCSLDDGKCLLSFSLTFLSIVSDTLEPAVHASGFSPASLNPASQAGQLAGPPLAPLPPPPRQPHGSPQQEQA